ncbi:MAG: GDSL-type esterase/lipase family protein, partial [Bryocella sp.]
MVKLLCPLLIAGVACAQENPAQLINAANPAARRAGTTVRIALVGDSTQTLYAGYGRGFCANFTLQVDCVDTAKGGASTRTFRDQGIWAMALATKPDYMVIQFGHNDNYTKAHRPNEVTREDYIANLKRFVTEARAENIKPILVTPLTRRYYQDDGKIHSDLTDFSNAMRDVAKEMNVPLIELQLQSIAYMDKFGSAYTDKLAMIKDVKNQPEYDRTHLNW